MDNVPDVKRACFYCKYLSDGREKSADDVDDITERIKTILTKNNIDVYVQNINGDFVDIGVNFLCNKILRKICPEYDTVSIPFDSKDFSAFPPEIKEQILFSTLGDKNISNFNNDYSHLDLSSIDFSNLSLYDPNNKLTFDYSNLYNSRFVNATLINPSFKNSDLSMTNFDGAYITPMFTGEKDGTIRITDQDVNHKSFFLNCKMIGTNFQTSMLARVDFKWINQHVHFVRNDPHIHFVRNDALPNENVFINFQNSTIFETRFIFGILKYSNFTYTDLSNSEFIEVDISYSLFSNCEIERVLFNMCMLKSTNFSKSNFNYTEFNIQSRRGFFDNVNFQESFFEQTNFTKIIGNNINMKMTTISDTSFTCSDFSNIYFNNSNIRRTEFEDVHFKNSSFEACEVLNEITFKNCTFEETSFEDSKYVDILFENSALKNVSFKNSTVNKLKFSNCNFENVNFEGIPDNVILK